MSHPTDVTALVVFGVLFALVTGLGFVAARWRRGDLTRLDEWGLGGRRFRSTVKRFPLGGDLYTPFTIIAVSSPVLGVGAGGFFVLPCHVLVYTLSFLSLTSP